MFKLGKNVGICHWDRGLITAPETPEKNPCKVISNKSALLGEFHASNVPFFWPIPGPCFRLWETLIYISKQIYTSQGKKIFLKSCPPTLFFSRCNLNHAHIFFYLAKAIYLLRSRLKSFPRKVLHYTVIMCASSGLSITRFWRRSSAPFPMPKSMLFFPNSRQKIPNLTIFFLFFFFFFGGGWGGGGLIYWNQSSNGNIIHKDDHKSR